MKINVAEECVRCGICIEIAAELFEMDEVNDSIRVKVDEVPVSLVEKARAAAEGCAVQAISLTE